MRNGTRRARSERNTVRSTATAPVCQFGRTRWNISIASGLLRRLPKPLSVMTQYEPSPAGLMPEKPCTGWPWKGRERPVGRRPCIAPLSPGTDPTASTRLLPGRVKRPETRSAAGASAGGWTSVLAGSSAWPTRTASKRVSAAAGPARPNRQVAASKRRRMDSLLQQAQAIPRLCCSAMTAR